MADTNTINTTNNGIVSNNMGYDPRYMFNMYLNQSINNTLISELKNIITKKFHVKHIFIIICLLGFDKIKEQINNLLDTMPNKLYYICKKIKNIINSYLYNSNYISIYDESDKNKQIQKYNHSISLHPTIYNILSKYVFFNKDSNVKSNKIINHQRISRVHKNIYYNMNIKDIEISFNGFNIKILNEIGIRYEQKVSDEIYIEPYSSTSFNDDYILIKRLMYNLPITEMQLCICLNKIHHFIQYILKTSNRYIVLDNYPYKIVKNTDGLNKLRNVIDIDTNNVNSIFNRNNNNYIFTDLPEAIYFYAFKDATVLTVTAILIQFYFEFSKDNNYNSSSKLYGCANENIKEPITINILHNDIIDLYYATFPNKNERFNIYTRLYEYEIVVYENVSNNHANDRFLLYHPSNIICMLITENDRILSKNECFNVFEAFINHLNLNLFVYTINVYNVNLIRKDHVIQEYEPARKSVVKKNDDTEETINTPEKQKIVESKFDSVVLNHINSIYKNFNTLYLKQDDEFKLKNILKNFNTKKKTYKELGLTFKFGCMLYGPPGTGKSSAVKAIASYLKKNIVYLDLKQIKSNEELDAIFKHINAEQNGKCIIVMEDIDCMNDIVLQRFDTVSDNKNDTFTFHLLNILDGTLTTDEMVFIATTNYIDKLDKALIRPGRFDLVIKLDYCDKHQLKTICEKMLKRELNDDLIDKLYQYKITPAQFIYKLLPYICNDDIEDSEIVQKIIDEL